MPTPTVTRTWSMRKSYLHCHMNIRVICSRSPKNSIKPSSTQKIRSQKYLFMVNCEAEEDGSNKLVPWKYSSNCSKRQSKANAIILKKAGDFRKTNEKPLIKSWWGKQTYCLKMPMIDQDQAGVKQNHSKQPRRRSLSSAATKSPAVHVYKPYSGRKEHQNIWR